MTYDTYLYHTILTSISLACFFVLIMALKHTMKILENRPSGNGYFAFWMLDFALSFNAFAVVWNMISFIKAIH